jgi:glycosyltransferase involved in cell wall biosynthesis
LPRPEEVILPGVVSHNDLAWAFQNALAYIQPSFMEGFGMPIIEAMSYGLPVTCSDTTCLPATAGGAALLFTPDQPHSISKRLLELWKDTALREELRKKGLARASEFTWTRHANVVALAIEDSLRNISNS